MKSIYEMSRSELAKKFNCKETEVLYADEIIDYKDLKKAKVIKGLVSMEELGLSDLGNVEVIVGESINLDNGGGTIKYALLVGNKAKTLGKLKIVYGNISLGDKCNVDFGELTDIHGNLYLNHTNIKSMGKIENIYGICSFDYSLVEDLGKNIKHIDKLIATNDFKLKRYGSLESLKYPVSFTNDDYNASKSYYNMDYGNKNNLVSRFMKEFAKDQNTGMYFRDPMYLMSLDF